VYAISVAANERTPALVLPAFGDRRIAPQLRSSRRISSAASTGNYHATTDWKRVLMPCKTLPSRTT
jgi:hypothetical protein